MGRQLRRLDDRIRELCAQVVAAKNPDDLGFVLPELQLAIHQAIEHLRIQAMVVLQGQNGRAQFERRKLR